MKKKYYLIILFILLFVFLGIFSVYADSVYNIDTKYGVKQVVVPTGATDLEVLKLLAKNYYELSYEHDVLLEDYKKATSDTNDYITENQKLRLRYDDLIQDYELLSKKYGSLFKSKYFKSYISVNAGFDDNKLSSGGISLGVIMNDKVTIGCGLQYPLELRISAGYVF